MAFSSLSSPDRQKKTYSYAYPERRQITPPNISDKSGDNKSKANVFSKIRDSHVHSDNISIVA